VLLRPPASRPLPELALVGGVAVALAIEREVALACEVKWPNDVLVDRQKVAGVLVEGRGSYAVLGFGVNVNQARAELPAETRTPAASLYVIDGTRRDRAPLLATLLEVFETSYRAWSAVGLRAVLQALREHDALAGHRILLDGRIGRALGIADDGRLEVQVGEERFLVASGEVTCVD
jgi:BirA family biotin operon repressor/biotin-[acetyl-CoA-carboxylase] ligase